MIQKRRIKAAGLCVLALGLIVLYANAVGAEPSAKWTIEKPDGTLVDAASLNASVGLKELEELTETKERHGTLITKINSKTVEIDCGGAEFVNVKLEGSGTVSAGAKARFTGCVVRIEGKPNKECEPKTGAEKGVITTRELKGLIVLHAGTGVVRVEPKEKEVLAQIETVSEECPIGDNIFVLGKFFVSVTNLLERLKEHLISQGPLTEIWVYSKTNKATIAGTALVKLIGEKHEFFRWSGTPG